jgi:hypothetical protein
MSGFLQAFGEANKTKDSEETAFAAPIGLNAIEENAMEERGAHW